MAFENLPCSQSDLTSRTGIAAGSPIPIDLMKSLIEKMNLTELTNAYGMSGYISCLFLYIFKDINFAPLSLS